MKMTERDQLADWISKVINDEEPRWDLGFDGCQHLASAILNARPEKSYVIEANLSPIPDIINDCEVRRQGKNITIDLWTSNMMKGSE